MNHTVTSGSGCTADNLFCSPSNTNCAAAPASSTGATYDRTFPSSGTFPYFCRPHCEFGMTGTVNVAAPAAPGAVPDGDAVPGVPLKLGKGPGGSLDLTWSNSCSGTATDYAVYEGTLPISGGVYTHTALNCSLGSTNAANIVPGAGNRYYLVVPKTARNDGSYGLDFIGGVRHQIPPAAAPCHHRSSRRVRRSEARVRTG